MSKFFGDKGLLGSMTAWGVIILAVVNAVATGGQESGLLSAEGASILQTVGSFIGTILAGLGARRAIGNSGSSA